MRDLNLLHPEVKAKAEQLVQLAKDKLGLRIIITQTLRSAEEQASYYAQGRVALAEVNRIRKTAGLGPITEAENKKKVTNAKTSADSFHGYGLAFDFAVTDASGKTIGWNGSDWNTNKVDDWTEIGKLGQSIGLEWGGDWKTLKDIPHFQFTLGWTIASLKAAGIAPGRTITRSA